MYKVGYISSYLSSAIIGWGGERGYGFSNCWLLLLNVRVVPWVLLGALVVTGSTPLSCGDFGFSVT